MHRPPDGVPIDRLRHALRHRIAQSSFRTAAREVGMSASGLPTFLAGTSPHYSTLRKVTAWYVREAQRSPGELDLEALRAALGLLTQHLPDSVRPGAISAILTAIRDASEGAAIPAPDWIETLSR